MTLNPSPTPEIESQDEVVISIPRLSQDLKDLLSLRDSWLSKVDFHDWLLIISRQLNDILETNPNGVEGSERKNWKMVTSPGLLPVWTNALRDKVKMHLLPNSNRLRRA